MSSKQGHKFIDKNSEELLESGGLKYIDLLCFLPNDHILKTLSLSISAATQLPPSSTFIAGLSVVSSILARKYVTAYPDGSTIPLGLYSVIEQPSGTGKSRCLSIFQHPVWKAEKEIRDKAFSDLAAFDEDVKHDKDDKKEMAKLQAIIDKTSFFTSNATPEALEQSLNNTGGFFSLVSAEQGLFNSMFGKSYRSDGGSGNNNDLMLHGYMGEFFNSIRVGRSGYKGRATGGVCLFSQSGSIETLLDASGSVGMIERFLMIAEPHSIGRRYFRNTPVIDKNLVNYYDILIEGIATEVLGNTQPDVSSLPVLMPCAAGIDAIITYKESIEPYLADGSWIDIHPIIKGAGVKTDMAIYKIAAILHIMNKGVNNAAMVNSTIDITFVISAINIVNTLFFSLQDLLKSKAIAGRSAEAESVMRIFENDNRPRTERQIIMSRSGVNPFKNASGSKSKLIRETINELVNVGILTDLSRDPDDRVNNVKTYMLSV